jgi:hypothetical protein
LRDVLVIVRPETVICWHRAGFRLYWRWRSRVGGRSFNFVAVQEQLGLKLEAGKVPAEVLVIAEKPAEN